MSRKWLEVITCSLSSESRELCFRAGSCPVSEHPPCSQTPRGGVCRCLGAMLQGRALDKRPEMKLHASRGPLGQQESVAVYHGAWLLPWHFTATGSSTIPVDQRSSEESCRAAEASK